MTLFLYNTELHYNLALLCSSELFPAWIYYLFFIFQSAPAEPQAQTGIWDGASLAFLRGMDTTPAEMQLFLDLRPGIVLTKPHLLVYNCTDSMLLTFLFLRKH